MANNLPTTFPDTFRPKSFWEKKEGGFGLGILGALALGVLFIFMIWGASIVAGLGFLVAAVGKLWTLAIIGTPLAGLIYFFMNRKNRLIVSLMFKSFSRWFASWWVTIDPIGIMKGVVEKLKERLVVLATRKGELRTQLNGCKAQIDQNNKEAGEALSTIQYIKNKGEANLTDSQKLTIRVKSNEYGRLQESTEKLTGTYTKLQGLFTLVGRYYEASQATIADLENQIKVSERDSKMMKSAYSAMKAAEAILAGSGDEYDLFNASLEYQADEATRMLTEIEEFVDSSAVIMEGIDMRSGVWEQKALDALATFESSDSKLLGGEKRLMLEQTQASPAQVVVPNLAGADYDKLFSSPSKR